MGARKSTAIALFALLASLLPAAAVAQTLGPGYPDRYPPPLPKRRGPKPPPLAFSLTKSIPVLGPISAAGAGYRDDAIVLHGPLGFVAVPLSAGSGPAPATEPPPPAGTDAEGWVYAPRGGWRFRTLPEGRVVAEKWWGSRRGWRTDWSLRVGGATPSPPVLVNGRVVFGSLDDQIYAVRADNGHRLWALDVGERVARPLALWRGTVQGEDGPHEVDAVLVTPEDSLSVIALDVFDGSRLATFAVASVPEGNALVSAPLVAPDGTVAVAHQGYAPEEAALLLLRLGPAPRKSTGGTPGTATKAPL